MSLLRAKGLEFSGLFNGLEEGFPLHVAWLEEVNWKKNGALLYVGIQSGRSLFLTNVY